MSNYANSAMFNITNIFHIFKVIKSLFKWTINHEKMQLHLQNYITSSMALVAKVFIKLHKAENICDTYIKHPM